MGRAFAACHPSYSEAKLRYALQKAKTKRPKLRFLAACIPFYDAKTAEKAGPHFICRLKGRGLARQAHSPFFCPAFRKKGSACRKPYAACQKVHTQPRLSVSLPNAVSTFLPAPEKRGHTPRPAARNTKKAAGCISMHPAATGGCERCGLAGSAQTGRAWGIICCNC